MKKRPDDHDVVEHAIEKAIVVHEQLPESRLIDLWHDSPSFGQRRQTGCGFEGARKDSNGATRRSLGKVPEHVVQGALR